MYIVYYYLFWLNTIAGKEFSCNRKIHPESIKRRH